MLHAVACQCGGADGWIRRKLGKFNSPQALTIPIIKGKEKSLSFISALPQTPETSDLYTHVQKATKFAIIIGTDGETLRWVDVVNGVYMKNDIDAEFIIRDFDK